jgi:hypothetical protein
MKKYERRQILKYLKEDYPRLEKLIRIFDTAAVSKTDVIITTKIGYREDSYFHTYLKTIIKNPKIFMTDSRIICLDANKHSKIFCIELDGIKNFLTKIIKDDVSSFDEYCIKFNYIKELSYSFNIKIYKH